MVSRFGVLVAVAMASNGCASATDPAPSAKGLSTEEDAGVDAGVRSVDPACSSRAGASRSEPPTGSCVTGAACEFTVPTGAEVCERGAGGYPATPPQYACECESGTWRCKVVGGGFGIHTCPDAGE